MKKIIKKLSILFASLAMVMGVALAKDDTHVVNAASSELVITISNFTEISTNYNSTYTHKYTLDDNSEVSVEAKGVYKNANGIQMNSGKGTYIKNTVALPGAITNIQMTWTATGKNSPTLYVASGSVASSSSTSLGKQSNSIKVQSVDVDKTKGYDYFYFDGTTVSGACYMSELKITYDTTTAPVDASEIINLIDAIGTVEYTEACKAKIDAAREAYNNASAELQAQVTNLQTLTDAEAEYARLEADAKETADLEAAMAFEEMVDALPEAETLTDYSKKSEIDALVAAYNALTDDQKVLVTETKVDKMNALVAKIEEFAPAVGTAEFVFSSSGTIAGTDLPAGVISGPITLTATKDGSTAWRSALEPLRVYTGAELTITGDATVEGIESVEIIVSSSYSMGSNYKITAKPSDTVLTYDTTTKSVTCPHGTTSVAIERMTTGRCDLDSISVVYSKVTLSENTKVESITLTPNTLELEVGETKAIIAEVLPGNAFDKTITWSTSDATIATVDTDGKVTAVKEGSASITATANDGSNIQDVAHVTVKPAALVNYESTEKIDGNSLVVNDVEFTIIPGSETDYRGRNGNYGAQFGTSANPAGTVTFVTRTTVFERSNFRVVVGATFTGGSSGTLKVTLGDTVLGEVALTVSSVTVHEFTIPASAAAAAAVNNSDILKIELTNNSGAVYLNTLKVYSDNKANINPADLFITDWRTLRDASGSICNALNDKTNLDALFARYDALTDAEKATVDAATDVEGVTIKQSMDYLRDVLNGTTKTDGDYGITPTESASNILTEVKDSSTIVILVAVLGVIAISAYYFVEKRKLAK